MNEKHCNLLPMHVLPGKPVSIEGLAQLVLELTKSESEILYTAGRTYDVEKFYGDPSRMNDILGYYCTIDIRTGLEKCIKSHLKKLKSNW